MQAWQDFLATQSFSEAPLGDSNLSDLSHLGLIRVSGDDKLTFLQGQLTNDINKVSDSLSQISSYCSPKGRMLTSFRIIQRGDELLLMLPVERLEATLKRLRMFVLMSKVTLEDASEQLLRIELNGRCTGTLDTIPTGDNAVINENGLTLIRLPGDRPRVQVIGEMNAIQPIWEKAAAQATLSSTDAWRLADIRAGLPTVYELTSEAFVPQMANMQLIDGVSFTKGCYTGQEVVARMQYLGKLKRRMYRVGFGTEQQPEPGTELYAPDSASGQGAGKIVDAAPSPEGGFEALIVTEIANAERGDMRLGDENGAVLNFLDMPYSFEQE